MGPLFVTYLLTWKCGLAAWPSGFEAGWPDFIQISFSGFLID